MIRCEAMFSGSVVISMKGRAFFRDLGEKHALVPGYGWDHERADVWVFTVLATVHRDWPFTKIGSGAQTGMIWQASLQGTRSASTSSFTCREAAFSDWPTAATYFEAAPGLQQEVRRKAVSMLTASA